MTRRKTMEAVALLLCSLVLTSGCYSNYQIKPSELTKLDGYPSRAPAPPANPVGGPTRPPAPSPAPASAPQTRYRLLEQDGKSTVELGRGDELRLKLRDHHEVGGRFSQIRIDPTSNVFEGQLSGGPQVRLSLSDVEMAKIRQPSVGKTVLGIGLGLVIMIGIFLGAAYASFASCGNCFNG